MTSTCALRLFLEPLFVFLTRSSIFLRMLLIVVVDVEHPWSLLIVDDHVIRDPRRRDINLWHWCARPLRFASREGSANICCTRQVWSVFKAELARWMDCGNILERGGNETRRVGDGRVSFGKTGANSLETTTVARNIG